MNQKDISRCERRLRSTLPLLGKLFQRSAARKLAADSSADAVSLLVESLEVEDQQAREIAEKGLRELRDKQAIEGLCEIAMKEPGGLAAKVCRETGKRPDDPDKACRLFVTIGHTQALRELTDRADVEALCKLALEDLDGDAAKVCIETDKRPSDPEDASLFLFVTSQFEKYFEEDFEFQHLRPAYDRASQKVRGYVMEIVRTGDVRFKDFFGARQKPLSECNEREIQTMIESRLRHRDWAKLFEAFLQMPLKYGFPLLAHFAKSDWEPETADLRSLYRQALTESDGQALPTTERPKPSSSVFLRWLSEGQSLSEGKLDNQSALQAIMTATPPEAVRAVAAVAARPGDKQQIATEVRSSPHWLVRLAGYATGLCMPGITEYEVADSNYWVRELSGSAGVLELWPVKATPVELEALASAPPEAWSGKLGAARRVLQLLIANRVSQGGTWTEHTVDLVEDAGVFEEAE